MNKNTLENLDDLITQSEAASLRGVSKASISELVKRGRLRTREMFGKKLVYRSEVLGFEKEKPGPKTESETSEANGTATKAVTVEMTVTQRRAVATVAPGRKATKKASARLVKKGKSK